MTSIGRSVLGRRAFIAAMAVSASGWTGPAFAQAVRPDRLQERGVTLRPPIIPAAFRGHWSEDVRACGAAPVDDSQMWIAARALDFYETNGHVVHVTRENARRAVVTLRSEGEGLTFVARKGLALSRNRRMLDIRDEDDTGSTRFHRCPAAPGRPRFGSASSTKRPPPAPKPPG